MRGTFVRRGIVVAAACSIALLTSARSGLSDQALLDKIIELNQKANEANSKKDYAASLAHLEETLRLVKDAPRTLYRAAGALALLGRKAESLQKLEQVINTGVGLGVGENPDFASLRGDPKFEALLQKAEALRKPAGYAAVAVRVPDKDLIPEGIAFDPKTKTFYLSSLYKAKIVAIPAAGGEPKDFTTEGQDGFWCGLGMKVDTERRILWAASAYEEAIRGFKQEQSGNSGVFKYDIDSGKLLKKYTLTNKPDAHILNDLVVTSAGDVFVTDTLTGRLYVIDHARDQLEEFTERGRFPGANGIALSPDEKKILVAHGFGIAVVDRAARTSFDLAAPASATLTGIDGLYWHDGSLIAVQADISRISRFRLNAQWDRVEQADVLDSHNQLFRDPTTGVVAGDSFFYIANCQYSSYNDDGTLFPIEKLQDVVILVVPLTR